MLIQRYTQQKMEEVVVEHLLVMPKIIGVAQRQAAHPDKAIMDLLRFITVLGSLEEGVGPEERAVQILPMVDLEF